MPCLRAAGLLLRYRNAIPWRVCVFQSANRYGLMTDWYVLGQVHGYLPYLCYGLFAAFGEHVLLLDIEVPAHFVEYEIYGHRFVLLFYRTFKNLFRQRQVYVAVPYDGVSHERVDDTFQFAYAVVHVFRTKSMTSSGIFRPSCRILFSRISWRSCWFGFSNSANNPH